MLLALAALASCKSPPVVPTSISTPDTAVVDDTGPQDADFDGWPADVDCDDSRAGINPGVQLDSRHVCKGVDHDCDGVLDGEEDVDQDGQSYCALDCDDEDPQRFRGNADPIDGIDQDCDGTDGVGEVPTTFFVGDPQNHSAGTVLHTADVDGDLCEDLLISEAGLTTRTINTGGGSIGELHAVLGCRDTFTVRSWSAGNESDGIACAVDTYGSGAETRVLGVGWYNAGERGVARVLDFTQDPPTLVQSFEGVDPGNMHAIAVIDNGATESALFQSRNGDSGPGRAWDLPFPTDIDFAAPDTQWWPHFIMTNFAFNLLAMDRDGDGADELMTYGTAFAPTPDGTVYVLDGPGTWETPNETWQGDLSVGTNFGSRIYPAPNLPLPGDGGLLAGSVGYYEGGALYLLPPLGPGSYTLADSPLRFEGEFEDEWFGFSAGVGDVNGDGEADVVVGAPQTSLVDDRTGEPGKVYVFLGPFTDPVQTREDARVFVGTQPGASFGWSVALADLDSDGTDEIYVGEPQYRESPTVGGVGAVYRLDL
jgi:hypothetical protein